MRYFLIAAGFAYAITAMLALGSAKADDMIMSDGKCWLNTSNGNTGWADCPKKATHHKASRHRG
jgi:hypothetical protein